MREIPSDGSWDATVAFLSEGYLFVGNRCDRLNSDVFSTRLMLQPAICLRGSAAAELLYDTDRFQRQDAMPKRGRKTLLGIGSVQGLDGEAHRHRKAMLMSVVTPQRVAELVSRFRAAWWDAIPQWQNREQVVLLDELHRLLCEAVCQWAAVPVAADDLQPLTEDLVALIEGATAILPGYVAARRARKRRESWLGDLVQQVRQGQITPPEDSALAIVARHRDANGQPLEPRVAAVELLNILRPTVAIARFIVFAALALHEHPEWKARLGGSGGAGTRDLQMFVQEVRRYYPFFPVVAARTRRSFQWNGYEFPADTRTVLDLYGTNHDARNWDQPERFDPERFAAKEPGAFELIPQGGNDHFAGHRCAGEQTTIEIMKASLPLLAGRMRYEVPEQDLSIRFSKMPTAPESGFIISRVSQDVGQA